MKFSRYTTIQNLGNDNYIMINALSGAIYLMTPTMKNLIFLEYITYTKK